MKHLIFTAVLFMSLAIGHAAEVTEFNYDGVSSKKQPAQAKREILKKASAEISKKLISELIGAEKYALQKNTIDRKILKNSNKYILYTKGGNLKAQDEGHAMTVTMKLSVQSLEKLLLKEGLLVRAQGDGRVLPLVTFNNKISGQSFSWWNESGLQSQMSSYSKEFHRELRRKFFDKGFYSFKPEVFGFYQGLDSAYQRARLDSSKQMELARGLDADMLIRGNVDWVSLKQNQYAIRAKLQVVHISNGRVIAEVVRNYKTSKGPALQVLPAKFDEIKSGLTASLVNQVFDSWQKGSLGTTRVKLVLEGSLSFSKVNELRKAIRSKVNGVRSVKHRGYQVGKITLEMDASSSSSQIAESLKAKSLAGIKLSVQSVSAGKIRVKVQ